MMPGTSQGEKEELRVRDELSIDTQIVYKCYQKSIDLEVRKMDQNMYM